MAVRDWPKPTRYAIGWAITSVSLAIAVTTVWLLIEAFVSGQASQPDDTLWAILLAHYATLVTAPIAIVLSAAVYLKNAKGKRDNLKFLLSLGVVLGVFIGLVLTPLTGGFSLIAAPPFSLAGIAGAWIWKRLSPGEQDANATASD